MLEFWRIAVGIAGLGAVGAFVFWSLYRGWLRLPIFAALTAKQTYRLMLTFLVLAFLALVSILVTYDITRQDDKQTVSAILREAGAYQKLSEQYRAAQEKLAKTKASEYEKQVASLASQLHEAKSEITAQVERLDPSVREPSTQVIQSWKSCVAASASIYGVPVSGNSCSSLLTHGLDTVVKTPRHNE